MNGFTTESGTPVPAVTAEQMREVDRIAVEEFGLGLLQMMENAGRNLAGVALEMLPDRKRRSRGRVVVLAGKGGNGGGGLCCARHLRNRGMTISVILTGDEADLSDGAASQLAILKAAGLSVAGRSAAESEIAGADLIVDALIGYSLRGAPSGTTLELIEDCNRSGAPILSLDVPSGIEATTGEAPGEAIRPECTLTLALPKTGLLDGGGEVLLADIGLPPEVYSKIGLTVPDLFDDAYWVALQRSREG